MNIFIALGSNLGARRKNIDSALEYLSEHSQIEVEKVSSIIETAPCGGPPQDNYLNAVARIKTSLDPLGLLRYLQSVEACLGRVRTVKNGPRTIDLDILLWGDKIINQPGLIVPHPPMLDRPFVMVPLRQIAPDIDKLLSRLEERDAYNKEYNASEKSIKPCK